MPGQYEAQATRHIATRTDQIVRGIQIAELWQDPVTKTAYALAVLPRLPAATSLRQEIERPDGATRTYLDQARASDDLFIKIGAASHALDAQLERQAYQKSLKIVDLTGRGVEPEWNSAEARRRSGRIVEARARGDTRAADRRRRVLARS